MFKKLLGLNLLFNNSLIFANLPDDITIISRFVIYKLYLKLSIIYLLLLILFFFVYLFYLFVINLKNLLFLFFNFVKNR
jgi:hypothetical protein